MENNSLRSVGKSVIGKVYKGSLISSSIEVEQKRFDFSRCFQDTQGVSTNRLEFSQSVSPGPGKYVVPSQISPSYSIKGYGGLINRAARFKKLPYKSDSPGPGSYEPPCIQSISISSAFMLPASTQSMKTVHPAPGDYDPKVLTHDNGFQSVFKSTTKRMELIGNDVPAPWQYTPMLPPSKSAVLIHKPADLVKRKKNLYDPFMKTEKEEDTPGPGNYEIACEWAGKSFKNKIHENKKIQAFSASNFKLKQASEAPGPGSYIKDDTIGKEPIMHSFFKSKIEKVSEHKNKIPGPAYYSPQGKEKKTSFLLNAHKVWV